MTPLDTESEQIRESTLRAYQLAESLGLSPSEAKQAYRPVDGSKRIATGLIELSPSNFESVQNLVNEYMTKGYRVSFAPFFNGSNGMSVSDYVKRIQILSKGRPKIIKIKLTDAGLSNCLPGIKTGNDFVVKEDLELIVRESKTESQNISGQILDLMRA